MNKVAELEQEIYKLTEEEYRILRDRILEWDWQEWDRQLEQDAESGALDFLLQEAEEAKRSPIDRYL